MSSGSVFKPFYSGDNHNWKLYAHTYINSLARGKSKATWSALSSSEGGGCGVGGGGGGCCRRLPVEEEPGGATCESWMIYYLDIYLIILLLECSILLPPPPLLLSVTEKTDLIIDHKKNALSYKFNRSGIRDYHEWPT